MKLNVDLTDLRLAAAEMSGLDAYLTELRAVGKGYLEGVTLAKDYVTRNGGTIEEKADSTVLTLFEAQAYCFQLYSDIDKFYFEI